MNSLLFDLLGAIGFQLNDTWTTFLGIKAGAVERNPVFSFLSHGKTADFVLMGIMKILVAVYLFAWALIVPAYTAILEFDFYLEVAVTLWNILTIYRHKVKRK